MPHHVASTQVPEQLFAKPAICDEFIAPCENGRGLEPILLDAWPFWLFLRHVVARAKAGLSKNPFATLCQGCICFPSGHFGRRLQHRGRAWHHFPAVGDGLWMGDRTKTWQIFKVMRSSSAWIACKIKSPSLTTTTLCYLDSFFPSARELTF